MNVDDLIARYLQLRDFCDGQTKALTEYLKPLRDEMEQITGKVQDELNRLGGDRPSIKTAHGTAFTTTKKNPKIAEGARDEYLKWCLANWNEIGNAMLQIAAPQVTAVQEYMDAHDGHLPPHVEINPVTVVTIRKA